MSAEPAFKHEDLDAAIEHFKANTMTEEARVDTLQKIEAHVSTPEAMAELVKQVENLSGSALAIDTNFGNILKLLTTAHAAVPQDLQNAMNGLTDKWKGYRGTYVDLLWDSRRLADEARVVVDDFGNTLLPFLLDKDHPAEAKKIEIEGYRKILSANEHKAANVSQGFTALHQNIKDFKAEWEGIAQKFRQQSEGTLKTLDNDIQRLTTELESLASKIKSLLIYTGVGMGVAFLVALINPFAGFFLAAVVVVTTGLPAVNAIAEHEKKSKELQEKKTERAKVAGNLEAVKQIESDLKIAENSFSGIFTGLHAFASVWATLRSDITYVSGSLEVVNQTGPESLLYKRRLEAIRGLYLALGKALARYAQIVSADHDLFKGKEVTPA